MGLFDKDTVTEAHNQGQTDESEDRSSAVRGWHTTFMSDEEKEAYDAGVENAKENAPKVKTW